jgi:hypothetical protein
VVDQAAGDPGTLGDLVEGEPAIAGARDGGDRSIDELVATGVGVESL